MTIRIWNELKVTAEFGVQQIHTGISFVFMKILKFPFLLPSQGLAHGDAEQYIKRIKTGNKEVFRERNQK